MAQFTNTTKEDVLLLEVYNENEGRGDHAYNSFVYTGRALLVKPEATVEAFSSYFEDPAKRYSSENKNGELIRVCPSDYQKVRAILKSNRIDI